MSRSGMLPARIVHVHPTRACNLACAHCYSASSPEVRSALDPAVVLDVLRALRAEGYEILSISGGEPLVYRGLTKLAAGAAELGYRVHLVTNGLLLSERRLAELRPHLHFVAVSLDGGEQQHNLVRGRADAFRKANAALELLGRSGVPFGIAYGVSHQSLGDVPWAWEHARSVGAQLLHLRPLVAEGRARLLPAAWHLDDEDRDRLALVAALLDGGPTSTPRIQLDLVATGALAAARRQFALLADSPAVGTLSDAVNPLVIDDEGRLVAFTYGIDPRFTIADVARDWRSGIAWFMRERLASVAALIDAAFTAASAGDVRYVDWFAVLNAVSRDVGDEPSVMPLARAAAPALH